ncbi:hypothetical protein H6F86_09960 [Phormidium sp. FACHB-592]|uniref:Uncharacterized protein n=1 Tax=Stenomitos frigidus AS-A4 TaxID=2933935 RepID=A0ABV0KRV9_9CYAN|nr:MULTISPECIES: hypothetical protein [Cyanophyceae]MBD2034882.1 hypothetical protein [Leptolyngbya sp. FACHB-321]MBD2074208.1 hypothetical protein [Phormidium sp. FACHB-592]
MNKPTRVYGLAQKGKANWQAVATLDLQALSKKPGGEWEPTVSAKRKIGTK